MTRGRQFRFAIAAIALSVSMTFAALLAVDLYIHHRASNSAGLNRWGYRGPVVGHKAAGEKRVVMLGGSTVFGYGGPWYEAAPAFLEQELRSLRPGAAVSVVNLGYNNEGAFAALPTLEDYRYLEYDIVVLYQGYNDRGGDGAPNMQVYRRQSAVYRLTGYSPMLPLLLKEKAMALRSGGLANAYAQEGKTVFHPNVAARTSAAALETANAIGAALGRQLDRLAEEPPGTALPGSDCAPPWGRYCESMVRATRYARAQGTKVLVVAQPVYPNEHARQLEGPQQASVAAALTKHFGADPGVVQLDLSHGIDLSDKTYSFDSMHLGRDGNLKLAQLMAPAVLELAWPEDR